MIVDTNDNIFIAAVKLPVSTSRTHGLIAQSVRASEKNVLTVGSSATQSNFL